MLGREHETAERHWHKAALFVDRGETQSKQLPYCTSTWIGVWCSDLVELRCLNEGVALLQLLTTLAAIVVGTLVGFGVAMARAEVAAASARVR